MFVRIPKFVQRIFPSIIWKNKTHTKQIWLTFDDGPEKNITEFILSVLKELDVKATFFLVGEQIIKFPELTKKILKDGHYIGNHSLSHINGFKANNQKYLYDVEMGEKLVNEKKVELGVERKNKIFRPPFGRIKPSQIKLLKTKYKIIMCDVFSWDFKKQISHQKLYNNVIKNVSPGSIIVFHNNMKSFDNLSKSLKSILIQLKDNGYSFSTTW